MAPEDFPKHSDSSLVHGRYDNDPMKTLSQSVLTEMQMNSQSKRLGETTLTKLMREADVVIGGTVEGTFDSGHKALTDPATLVKFGTSAILATGLTLAQGKKGLLSLSAQAGSLALAGAFAKDVYGKGEETLGIMQDTWNSPEKADQNKKAVADTLGPFVVDFGIFSAGGAAGIGSGKYLSKQFFGGETPTRAFRMEPEVTGTRGISKSEPGMPQSEPLFKPTLLSRDATVRGSFSELMAKPLSASANVEGAGFKPPSGSFQTSFSTSELTAGATMPVRTTLEIPIVELGASRPRMTEFPNGSPIATIFETTSPSIGKIEVLSVRGELIEARTASAVSLGEGRLVTNHHVTQNASDITIFDSAGKPHKAYTVAFDPAPDLAIVQLRDRSSFQAFAEARFKNREGYEAPGGGTVFAVGHYDSHNSLTVSPGIIPQQVRQTPLTTNFQGSVKNGNSGGALVNLEGETIGIVKSGFEGEGRGFATPSWQIDRVARHGEKVDPPAPLSDVVHIATTYSVDNVAAAKANVAKLFDTALEGTKPPEFFHSKVKRVEVPIAEGRSQQLVLQTQISPLTSEVHVEPISWGGKPISPTQNWPGTSVPISGSRLSLKFEPGLGRAEMTTVNDPLGILPEGFNYRSENNYLASLVPKSKLVAGALEYFKLH